MEKYIFRIEGTKNTNQPVDFLPLNHQKSEDTTYFREGEAVQGHCQFILEIISPIRANISALLEDLKKVGIHVERIFSDPKNGSVFKKTLLSSNDCFVVN